MKKKFLFLFIATLLVLPLLAPSLFAAKKGQSTTIVSFGSYQTTDGSDTVSGSQLALSYLSYFTNEWAYFAKLGNASASGQHTEGSQTSDLKAQTTTLSGGLQWSQDIDIVSSEMMPFIGAGFSIQSYTYRFVYENSQIGETSGTGYGPLIQLGLKLNLSDHFIIIPGYHYEVIYIDTEDGEKKGMTSSGISLALVARF